MKVSKKISFSLKFVGLVFVLSSIYVIRTTDFPVIWAIIAVIGFVLLFFSDSFKKKDKATR